MRLNLFSIFLLIFSYACENNTNHCSNIRSESIGKSRCNSGKIQTKKIDPKTADKKNETNNPEQHTDNNSASISNTTNAATASDTTIDNNRTNEDTPDQAIDHIELDPDKHISPAFLKKAVDYYYANVKKIKNKDVIVVIDFSKNSSKERFYIIDMTTGNVEKYLTAHGRNSDPNHDGLATKFSNVLNSNQSSLGFYLTAETYNGKHGYSLRLDGLSTSNSNARKRDIVIHKADYVGYGLGRIGRSNGCPALDPKYSRDIIDRIKGGALIYAGFKDK